MPRRNRRKVYTAGKVAEFFDISENTKYRSKCSGCAFVGRGGVCKTSDGTCLITIPHQKEGNNNAVNQRQADTASKRR